MLDVSAVRGRGRGGGGSAGAGPASRPARPAVPAALAALLLIGALVGQAAATTAVADRLRLGRLDDYAPWGEPPASAAAAVIAKADGWPRYRTDPGREQTAGNDPMLVGGQGGAYYSSHTPDVFTRTLAALGARLDLRRPQCAVPRQPGHGRDLLRRRPGAHGARRAPGGDPRRGRTPPL